MEIRPCANKFGDTIMAFTLNKVLFHRRTGQNNRSRVSEVLGATGDHSQGSCSSKLVLSSLSRKGK